MAAAKLELKVKGEASTGSGIKVERSVKAEGGCRPPAVKLESKVKGLNAAAVKAELRQQEAKLKVEAPSRISALVERGLQLRALAAKVKQERKVKVKKELKRVKKEHKKRKTGGAKRGVRRKGSAARRNASREAMNRAVPLSKELAELVGARALSRPEVVSRLWALFRERGLLNPADKREALFDERFQALFGKPSARIFELHSLLMPHLDYTSMGAEAATTADDGVLGREAKPDLSAKGEASAAAKCEATHEAKREAKHELPSNAKREAPAPAAKRERPCEAPVPEAKRERHQEEGCQQLKREIATERTGAAPGALAAAVRALVPRFSKIARTSAALEFLAPAGDVRLEAVVVPLGAGGAEAAAPVVRQPCMIEFREGADGVLEPCAEVLLDNLEPATAYRVSIHALIPNAEGVVEEVSSAEATVPQRACPAKWTPSEAQLWCGSLQVPELGRKVREYRVDGATLLALEEEDVRALGVAAPFLVRRVMAALQGLRAG